MKCAIVALSQGERHEGIFGLGGRRRSIYEEENVYATESITVFTFGADVQKVCEWSEKKLRKAVKKCIKELAARGVQSVYLTGEVEEFVGREYFSNHFRLPDGREIFDALLCDVVKWCGQHEKIDLSEAKVGIWQRDFDEHGYESLIKICGEYKYVSIFTNATDKAKSFAARLYENTGASVNVVGGAAGLNKCDVAILVDAPDNAVVNEKTVVIDMSGKYPHRCKNSVEFTLAFGYNALMKYFGIAEQRCMAFLFDACDISLQKGDSIVQYLDNMGCVFEKVLYISNKKY